MYKVELGIDRDDLDLFLESVEYAGDICGCNSCVIVHDCGNDDSMLSITLICDIVEVVFYTGKQLGRQGERKLALISSDNSDREL